MDAGTLPKGKCTAFSTHRDGELASADGNSATLTKFRRWGIAYPLTIDCKLRGVVALEIETAREDELRSAMEQLQWGMLSLELIFRRIQARDDAVVLSRLRSSVDVVASVLAEEEYTAKFVPAGSGVAPIGVGWPGRTSIGAAPPTGVTD